MTIEYIKNLNEELDKMIGSEFDKFAAKNEIVCNYVPFAFAAKENDTVIGIVTGHSYYNEAHIADLIVYEQYRNKRIGSKLMEAVESYCKNKGFANINLSTYNFQAPGFYLNHGFELEFIRENKENPKLNKYFFVKYL